MTTKYVIKNLNGEYLQRYCGDDCFTDDLGFAILFDSAKDAQRECIDDEVEAEVEIDEEGNMLELI